MFSPPGTPATPATPSHARRPSSASDASSATEHPVGTIPSVPSPSPSCSSTATTLVISASQREPAKFVLRPTASATTLQFRRQLAHLSSRLHPLLSITTGTAHPAFPATLLNFHLLTEAQLDELAHHYHQRTPGAFSLSYPCPVVAKWEREGDVEDKRRRFGRFCGLRGCESPEGGWGREEEGAWEAMKRYVDARVRRGLEEEAEREMRREKGF